jgi:PncC family amidohydrolase
MFAIDRREMHPLLSQLHELCLVRKLTIATAESCTGGLISALLTSLPGSSAYFRGGVCSYSNEAKCRLIGVSAELIRNLGAVSENVAKSMAEGARKVFDADISVAVTGIAGPGGGSAEKPVGTVYVGFATQSATEVLRLSLDGDRDSIRAQTCLFALSELYQLILSS